jgi:hypothetical protein
LSLVSDSSARQNGSIGNTPYERIVYLAVASDTYHIAVAQFAGAIPSWIQVRAFSGQTLEYSTVARSITSAAASTNTGLLGVGATPWFNDDTIETFSSQGPTIDGRTKPDIVGVDRGDSATYGPSAFSGTSQASPHVAGLAALVKQRFPSMTPFEVATFLKANALPRGAAPNNTWGSGLAQLPAIEPGAPTGVAATPDDGQAAVTWDAPADSGSAITGYTVTASPGGNTAAVGGSSLIAVVTGLTNDTPYFFVVGASNAVGASTPSVPSATTTPKGPPLAPTNITAVPGNAEATVRWSAPASDGGSSILLYNIISTPGSLTKAVNGTDLTGVVTGLTNGTAYTFTVTAFNALGAGPQSTSSPGVVPKRVPDTPINVLAIAGDESASVTWDAPASDGGSPILQYNVSTTPGGLGIAVDGSTFTATVTGLTNFVGYTFIVTAVNLVGEGPPSDPSNEVTPPNDPPEVTASPNTSGDEDALLTLQLASFTDSDVVDAHTASVDWGDGATSTAAVTESGGSGTISASHTYANDGSYIATMTVTDSFGGVGVDSFAITVVNVAPSVFAGGTRTTAGSSTVFPSVHFTDVGILDTHSAEIDWGDGATSTASVDASRHIVGGGHTYTNPGQFIVTVTVTDDSGDSGSGVLTIDVTSAPVAVSIPSLSNWGLVVLATALGAAFVFRRRSFDRLGTNGDRLG